ncbi:type II secretion system F family protein [Ramlibacter monticola]|uniref:Type II secretion system F family protein n=1 Tax=Ramlibacter monticola TaxID=1926872 RepID=A0A936YY68_9BURK|nr:type II secretion system F family protein [Ramlibacter monticola]MBL0390794.1 type II secretion system F family protein [Ramlibacter monticola]
MQFQVKALDGRRGIIQLTLDAGTLDSARQQAEHQGLRVIAVAPVRKLASLGTSIGRSKDFPLVLFSQELATLLSAGLSLITALESLAEKEHDSGTRKVLASIVRLLYEGKSFSQALAQFPGTFPDLYVALIQSSEKTGAIHGGLQRYVAYRTRIDMLTQKIVSASVYPVLLLLVGMGVLLFLVGYVVPRFSTVFGEVGAKLPWLSQVLMNFGSMINQHVGALALSAVALAAVAAGLWQVTAVRAALGQAILALPGVRERVFLYHVTRLYRSLGILLQSGIPILQAIGMARGLIGARMGVLLDQAAQRVREGQPLSQAFEANHLSTPVALRMLHAGEQAGNLGAMMEKTADFYDEEMGRWIEWFVRLFEPLLMVFVGAVIGVVVILMYIPIFELAGSIR